MIYIYGIFLAKIIYQTFRETRRDTIETIISYKVYALRKYRYSFVCANPDTLLSLSNATMLVVSSNVSRVTSR